MKWQIQILLSWLIIGRPAEDNKMPSRGQQLGKLLNPTGDIVETSLPPKIETFSQSVSNTGKIEKAALGNDVSTIEQVSDISLLTASGNTVGDQRVVGNNLYIWNGSGWFRIALINETPTWDSGGQPAASYVLDADSPQDATVITLAATDPDGFPISYSYVTGGSMDSIATISQDSSVFTITPKTSVQAPDGGTGSITFRATDGVNILPQVSSFTLNFVTTAENSRYTTLLATATGTSDNNNITDSSTNNHTITVNGDAHAGTFSPYRSGGYSTYFDGTTNTYLNVSSSSHGFAIGSGDFTISFWVYANDTTSPNYLLDYRPYNISGGNYPHIRIHSDGTFKYNIGGATVITGNTVISSKQWVYFCLARDNGTTKMYVNGTLQTDTHSGTESLTNGTNRPVIGTGAYAITPMFDGYISDLRVVTSLDTTAYSVPTERLEAVTNTQLLTCHLPYIADGSTNDHSITVNGDVSTKPFSPYDYEEYSATDHGGSVYFDGSGDVSTLTLGTSLGTSNFTIEAWVYPTLISSSWKGVLSTRTSNGSSYWSLGYKDNKAYFYDGGTTFYGSTDGVKNNAWIHLAIIKSGSSLKFFENGKNTAITTTSTNLSATSFFIGGHNTSWGEDMTGFVSDAKITLSDSVYTFSSDFTPPTAPISSSNAILHIKGTDASIIDKSQSANLKLVGNTTGSTTQVKFAGTKSMYFDGNQDMTHSVLPAPLASQATIEFWMYSSATNKRYVFGIGIYEVSSFLGIDTYGGVFKVKATSGTSGSTTQIIADVAYSANTWYHVAIVRDGTTYELYVDGISKGTGTYGTTTTYDNSYDVTIGTLSVDGTSTANPWSGYIQDFRITNGLARYTANFTPPTASLEG